MSYSFSASTEASAPVVLSFYDFSMSSLRWCLKIKSLFLAYFTYYIIAHCLFPKLGNYGPFQI